MILTSAQIVSELRYGSAARDTECYNFQNSILAMSKLKRKEEKKRIPNKECLQLQ